MARKKAVTLKLLSGNPARRPIMCETRLQPAIALPPAPAWLSSAAKAKYRTIGKELMQLDVMTALDGAALAAYAQACADLAQISKILSREGDLIKHANGILYCHPALEIKRSALSTIKQFGEALGLTPMARERITVQPQTDESADPLEELKARAQDARS